MTYTAGVETDSSRSWYRGSLEMTAKKTSSRYPTGRLQNVTGGVNDSVDVNPRVPDPRAGRSDGEYRVYGEQRDATRPQYDDRVDTRYYSEKRAYDQDSYESYSQSNSDSSYSNYSSRHYDPRYSYDSDSQYTDSQYTDSQYTDFQHAYSHSSDSRYSGSQYSDNSRYADPRGAIPRVYSRPIAEIQYDLPAVKDPPSAQELRRQQTMDRYKASKQSIHPSKRHPPNNYDYR